VLLVAVSECTKYTSKELEELRRFYYDDDDPSEETSKEPRKQAESRSSQPSKKKSSKGEEEEEDGEKDMRMHEELIKDAKKYLNAGKKTIDKGAQQILPRILLRPFRSVSNADKDSSEYDADSENDEPSSTSSTTTTTTRRPIRSRKPAKDRRRSTTQRSPLLAPFERASDDFLNQAQDVGGKFLKFLSKVTPPSSIPLPTLVPNFEDLGG